MLVEGNGVPETVPLVTWLVVRANLECARGQLVARKEIHGFVWWLRPTMRTAGRKSALTAAQYSPSRSQNVPHLLGRVAELAAGHTGTETVVADTDGVVLERVSKVIVALGHGTNEDGDALLGTQRLDVVLRTDHGGVETHGDLAAVGREVVGDGVLDDLEQLLLRVGGADGQSVEQLDHQTGEPLERSRNAHGGIDLDENALGRVNEDLKAASLIDG